MQNSQKGRLPWHIREKIAVNEDGCWLWTGALSEGYGRQRVRDFVYLAHRLVYELLVEPIPEGFDIDHLCRVRRCVNPAHLEPVTRAENLRRGRAWHSAGLDEAA